MPNPNFRADLPTVQPGQCTTLRWDVDEIAAIYFFDGANETGVGGHDSRQVCPQQTTTYRLRIVNRDSDNLFAEVLLKRLATSVRRPGTTATGAATVRALLQPLGVRPRIVDGLEILAWAAHPEDYPEPPPGTISRIR